MCNRRCGTDTVGKTDHVRMEIHVRPGASRPKVGGAYGGALVVRVAERAEDGRATVAALKAVAEALAIPHSSVTLVHGATSRRKLIEIDANSSSDDRVERTVARLRGQVQT